MATHRILNRPTRLDPNTSHHIHPPHPTRLTRPTGTTNDTPPRARPRAPPTVTFIEALDRIMPTFDQQIAQVAQRMLVRPRAIDSRVGVFAAKVTPGVPGERPVRVRAAPSLA